MQSSNLEISRSLNFVEQPSLRFVYQLSTYVHTYVYTCTDTRDDSFQLRIQLPKSHWYGLLGKFVAKFEKNPKPMHVFLWNQHSTQYFFSANFFHLSDSFVIGFPKNFLLFGSELFQGAFASFWRIQFSHYRKRTEIAR